MTLDVYRITITVMAIMAATSNLGLAWVAGRNRAGIQGHRVWAWFAVTCAALGASVTYGRLSDSLTDVPLSWRDIIPPIPAVLSFVASMVGWRWLGRHQGRTQAPIPEGTP